MTNPATEDPIQYTCWQCLDSFPNSKILFNHLETTHTITKKEDMADDILTTSSGSSVGECDNDEIQSSEPTGTEDFTPLLDTNMPFSSPNISKSVVKSEFSEHIISPQIISNSFRCEYCNETFNLKDKLIQHVNLFHRAENVYNPVKIETNNDCCYCDICQKSFTKLYDLAEHMKSHSRNHIGKNKTSEKSDALQIECTMEDDVHAKCLKVFSSKSQTASCKSISCAQCSAIF
eukprot:762972_1